jgi:hypothetical protein
MFWAGVRRYARLDNNPGNRLDDKTQPYDGPEVLIWHGRTCDVIGVQLAQVYLLTINTILSIAFRNKPG